MPPITGLAQPGGAALDLKNKACSPICGLNA